MIVSEMMERMPASEFTTWLAFHQIEPIGGEIDDYRAGLGPAVYVNAHLGKDGQQISPLQFFPHHNPPAPQEELTPEEAARAIKARIFGIAEEGEE